MVGNAVVVVDDDVVGNEVDEDEVLGIGVLLLVVA